MTTLYVDIETYSSVPIDAGTYRYSESRDFRILMAAWSVDGGETQLALGDDVLRIPGLTDPAVTKVAHNAAFERVCFSRALGRKVGDYLPADEWRDTMAIAAELGYPLKLGRLALALGAEEKDEAGTRLINWFCKPDPKGNRRLPEDHPDKWLDFLTYCVQDVDTLVDVDRRMGGRWPTRTEHRVWLADQAINDRGIAVDQEMCRAAVKTAAATATEQEARFVELLGVDNPRSNPQVLAALRATGGSLAKMPDLRKETIEELLSSNLRPDQQEALELRQGMALVASKKYSAALRSANSDGRLRGSFRFFGAHTGRWSGKGVQLQNLARPVKDFPKDDVGIASLVLDLKLGLGASPEELKSLVRSMFTGPLTVVDYSAIEARVVAWLAGEQWALDAFREGRDIYVETANRMSTPGRPLDRSQGKVAVLALGYQGWVNSLRVMGAEGSEDQLVRLAKQWRRANPHIVGLWASLQETFRTGGAVGPFLSVEREGKDRIVRLPSGRGIHYRNCSFRSDGEISFRDPRMGWTVKTYGGRLTENATQAVARDILAEALVRLEDNGFPVVGHVHDEILVEGSDLDAVKQLMVSPPAWSEGLPIDGEGFVCQRYRKD